MNRAARETVERVVRRTSRATGVPAEDILSGAHRRRHGMAVDARRLCALGLLLSGLDLAAAARAMNTTYEHAAVLAVEAVREAVLSKTFAARLDCLTRQIVIEPLERRLARVRAEDAMTVRPRRRMGVAAAQGAER